MGYPEYLESSDSDSSKAWALVEFASWCCVSEGNLANTISGKFAAVQYFHRLNVGVELPVTAPVVQCALKSISRSHAAAGTPRRVRLPVSFGMLLTGETLIPSWGPEGKVLWLCLCLSYFLLARSDEMFAADSGAIHSVHCLTRGDVAFYADGTQLEYLRWRQADKVEVRFTGHKGDQEQVGSVRVRTRTEVRGSKSSFRVDGGAVALMLELMSCFPGLPDHAPLSSYRCGKSVRVVRYGRALRAIKELVAKSGRNPDEFALHSLRIGGATTLAAGGDISERVIQREGRWRSDAYKAYTRNTIEDSGNVSRKLVVARDGKGRQPGEGTVWGRKR